MAIGFAGHELRDGFVVVPHDGLCVGQRLALLEELASRHFTDRPTGGPCERQSSEAVALLRLKLVVHGMDCTFAVGQREKAVPVDILFGGMVSTAPVSSSRNVCMLTLAGEFWEILLDVGSGPKLIVAEGDKTSTRQRFRQYAWLCRSSREEEGSTSFCRSVHSPRVR